MKRLTGAISTVVLLAVWVLGIPAHIAEAHAEHPSSPAALAAESHAHDHDHAAGDHDYQAWRGTRGPLHLAPAQYFAVLPPPEVRSILIAVRAENPRSLCDTGPPLLRSPPLFPL